MAIIGNALFPFILPETDLYLIREGIIQPGYTFKTSAIAWSSSSNSGKSSKVTQKEGYLQVRSTATGSTRGGSAYIGQENIKSIITDYSVLHVKCRRILPGNSTAYYCRIGTYDYSISGNYSSSKFLDYVTKQTSSDSSVVTLDIPITSATTNRSVVQICFAYVAYISSTTGVDIYDVWLSK